MLHTEIRYRSLQVFTVFLVKFCDCELLCYVCFQVGELPAKELALPGLESVECIFERTKSTS